MVYQRRECRWFNKNKKRHFFSGSIKKECEGKNGIKNENVTLMLPHVGCESNQKCNFIGFQRGG
jgi:hypothetical protein